VGNLRIRGRAGGRKSCDFVELWGIEPQTSRVRLSHEGCFFRHFTH
jgi:hypothetical protein